MPGLHRGPSEQGPTRLDSWSKLRALRPKHEWPGRAARARRPSEPARIQPGELVDTTGPRTRARVTRDSWSTTDAWSTQRALRPKHEWPVKAGQPRGPSEPARSHPGELVNSAGPWAWARVSQESWWTPWALGPGPDSPKPSDQPHWHSVTSASRPGLLVHPTGNRTQTWVARDSCSNPHAFRHGPESPGTTGGPCWSSGMGQIPLGPPVDPTGPQTRP